MKNFQKNRTGLHSFRTSHVPGPFHGAAPQGDPPIKSKDAGTTPTVGPLQPYDGSCPYAQAYIPSKTEAAGRDYKNMRKEPGPANKQ